MQSRETGATLGFDAIGGGTLAATILSCMEKALSRKATAYNRYGSSVHKQVYIYGGLDLRPTELPRNFGMAWGVGGWLMTWFLHKIGPRDAQELRERVAAELTTTFASHYTAEISLSEALSPPVIAAYNKRATGEKYLITPNGADLRLSPVIAMVSPVRRLVRVTPSTKLCAARQAALDIRQIGGAIAEDQARPVRVSR